MAQAGPPWLLTRAHPCTPLLLQVLLYLPNLLVLLASHLLGCCQRLLGSSEAACAVAVAHSK